MRYAHDVRIVVEGRLTVRRYSALADAISGAVRKVLGRTKWIMFGPDLPGVATPRDIDELPERWKVGIPRKAKPSAHRPPRGRRKAHGR